jgi:hypothetical protein
MKKLTSILLASTLGLFASTAGAVGTRSFDMSAMEDLASGDLTGVSVDSKGIVRSGWVLGKTAVNDAQSAWGSVLLPDGTLLIGTGNEGKLLKVSGSQVEIAGVTEQMAITTLVTAWNGDVIAGTIPAGKFYRIPKGQASKAEKLKEWGTAVEGVEYVWATVYDEKSKSIYAATGPEGKVLRIDEQGRAQVHYDADDSHVVSLALGPDGKVYCGTAGKAILYRIDAPGRAAVVHDFDSEDVSNIAVQKDGTVWATGNKYGGSFTLPGRGGFGMAGPSSARPSRPGEGTLIRVKGGTAETMMESRQAHFTSLVIGDDGQPYLGTGAEGRVLTVNDDHYERIVADAEERQIQSMFLSGKRRLLVTSDPIVVREVKADAGADSVWTSKVLDAGLPAEFGQLSWRGQGSVEVETRSGSTQDPDSSWSAWTKPLTASGKPGTAKGRYVQMRARFKDGNATFGEVRFHFLTENVRAIIKSISADGRAQRSGRLSTGMQASGGKVSKGSPNVSVRWEVENPDRDELRYRISYRLDSQQTWRDALKPTDIFTQSSYDWDTSTLPEGLYRMRVEATDELVNAPDKITKHSLESGIIVVDNTAPLFGGLAINGRKLTGDVTDGLGPISRIEIALAGSDDWRPIFPKDGIFDSAKEEFDADVSAIVPAGSRLIGVRAWDTNGNSVLKELEAK